MKLSSRLYLALAKQYTPKLCSMTLPYFGYKADMTIGFEEIKVRGTWAVPFAKSLLKQAQSVHKEAQK